VQRPQDIQQLAPVIDRLVTCGGARVPKDAAAYLRYVGVGASDGMSDWMWPTQAFLSRALPASDINDLLRRVAVRDMRYRFHVDLSMCSVIHAVAISERWKRLEELLLGQCRTIAPRLVQILSWLALSSNLQIREISAAKFQRVIEDNADPVFRTWDEELWGNSRGPADLFPLLMDLYLPLGDQPCHVASDCSTNRSLLKSLIDVAAQHGEGLTLSGSEFEDLQGLQNCGLPIRAERRPNQSIHAYIVGNIEMVDGELDRVGEPEDLTSGITANAKASSVIEPPERCVEWSLQNPTSMFAPVSVDHDALRWPAESLKDAPDWLLLPGSDLVSTAAKRRKDSQDADTALQQISRHPLYGFILQLFLMEALDRELGEETLALALPQNRKLETSEDWVETKVLYRPREESANGQDIDRDGFLVLGSFDDVIPVIGREVGIKGIATPYKSDVLPWSRAVYLMSTAGIVDGRPHSWRLTITSFILDRLHSGSLMKDVIRGGRGFRDRLHGVLSELWKEQTTEKSEEQVPA
jgi:hypothetical protein